MFSSDYGTECARSEDVDEHVSAEGNPAFGVKTSGVAGVEYDYRTQDKEIRACHRKTPQSQGKPSCGHPIHDCDVHLSETRSMSGMISDGGQPHAQYRTCQFDAFAPTPHEPSGERKAYPTGNRENVGVTWMVTACTRHGLKIQCLPKKMMKSFSEGKKNIMVRTKNL